MSIAVCLEIGSKRTFAVALDWPGWSRSGKDQDSALNTLFEYAPRYAAALRSARLGFRLPADISSFVIAERLKGDTTTDFGAPGRVPGSDARPVEEADLRRLQSILKACWRCFDDALEAAAGKTLRSGPRGGGRDRQKIVSHVLGAEQAYLSRLGIKFPLPEGNATPQQLDPFRQAILDGVAASARGELPAQGPRGGAYWPARYFVRREAWHVLDHAWEIQDRLDHG